MARPIGVTGKYRDQDGKPIGVYEWRKLNKGKWNAEKKPKLTKVTLHLTDDELNSLIRQAIRTFP